MSEKFENMYDYHRFLGTVVVSKDRKKLILIGDPDQDGGHNCDEMGCSSIDHVLARAEITSEGW